MDGMADSFFSGVEWDAFCLMGLGGSRTRISSCRECGVRNRTLNEKGYPTGG